jgi:hypothetical protein
MAVAAAGPDAGAQAVKIARLQCLQFIGNPMQFAVL